MNFEIKKCARCKGDFCTSPCYFDRQPNESSLFKVEDPVLAPPIPPRDRAVRDWFVPNVPPDASFENEAPYFKLVINGWLFGLLCLVIGYAFAYLIHAA